MALTVRKPEGEGFILAPQGTHVGRCYLVADLGLQDTPFGAKHKIRIGWELCNELMDDGRPFVVGKEYTASLHPDSLLAQDLVSWRGKTFSDEELAGFDVFKVLNAPCMLTVIHNTSKQGKQYANVKSVSSIPKGMQCPELKNECVSFSLEAPDEAMFQKLPEWLRNRVNRGGIDQPSPPVENYDDIPF